MKIRGGSYFIIVIIVIMLATIVSALSYPRFATKLLPLVFAGIVLILATVELVRDMRARADGESKSIIFASLL